MKFNFYDNILYPIRKALVSIHKFRHRIGLRVAWIRKTKKNTKLKLTKEEKRQVRSFYKPYHRTLMLFHAFYKEKTGKFCKDYIPDDLYYAYIDQHFNNWDTAPTIDNKCFYDKLFPNVLQPDTVLKRINNIWFNGKNEIIKAAKAREILSTQELFAKYATFSEGGHGVFFLNSKETAHEFWKQIEQTNRDIVAQKPICQHAYLAGINASSVNTVRVLSLLSDNGVKIYSSILRIGINGAKVDNASSGGITCGIMNDGHLKGIAYTSTGEKYRSHPNSNVIFKDCVVPSYSKIVDCVMKLHLVIPHYRLVSWDFAVREDGEPILVEANLRYGELDFHQLNNGPVFGDDTPKILSEVFKIK